MYKIPILVRKVKKYFFWVEIRAKVDRTKFQMIIYSHI